MRAARFLLESGPLWIAKTVLLETAWVLKKGYLFTSVEICGAFEKLLGLRNVHVEDRVSVMNALELVGRGVEIADAIRLCGMPEGARFATFDRQLVKCAVDAGVEAFDPTGEKA